MLCLTKRNGTVIRLRNPENNIRNDTCLRAGVICDAKFNKI